MIFEMSFIGLVFFPRLRRVAALGGVMFHIGSLIFLRIFFYDLLICYVALFDVSGWLKQVGHRLFKKPIIRLMTETVACAGVRLPPFGRLTFWIASPTPTSANFLTQIAPGRGILIRSKRFEDIHAISDERQYCGFPAYRAMAVRIPVLWPIVPILYLSTVERAGNELYRRVKHSRGCSAARRKESLRPGLARHFKYQWSLVGVVGLLLVSANAYAGMRGIVSGWPIACYPTFQWLAGDETVSTEIVALAPDGKIIPTNTATVNQTFSDQRLRGLLEDLQKPGESAQRLK